MGARKLQESSSERHGMLKTKKQASSSSEAYGILKAKKEALAAARLLHFHRVPRGSEIGMDHWREMKAKAAPEAARPVKKRKRVLKQSLPKALIDHMVAMPFRSVEDLSPAQLAKRPTEFRQYYPLTTFVDAKLRDYEQALIRQYNAVGYDGEEDATVVEN